MDHWNSESCRACLVHDDISTMYDLDVPDTMQLFTECSNSNISIDDGDQNDVPQYLCEVCYRLCEMWRSFKRRCLESERKLSGRRPQKRVQATGKEHPPVVKQEFIEKEEEDMAEVYCEPDLDPLSSEEDMGGSSWWDMGSEVVPKEKKKRKGDGTSGPPVRKPRVSTSEVSYEHLQWAPGTSKNEVWKHFLRDTTKKYSKCLWPDCGRVLSCANGSTSSMRAHIFKRHGCSVPSKEGGPTREEPAGDQAAE